MICKKCGKTFEGKYSKWCKGDFCSKQCARGYGARFVIGNKKINCVSCGKEIEVDKRASPKKCKCDNCKKRVFEKIKIHGKTKYRTVRNNRRKCRYCGQIICLRKDICKKFNLFRGLIKYFGFNKDTIGTLNVYVEYDRIKAIIETEYFENKLGIIDLCKKYNNNNIRNFWKILKSLNIKIRTISDGVRLAIHEGRQHNFPITTFQVGWHTTWNNKKVFYRSSYELDYCKELDEKKIDYEMESKRFWYWDSQEQKQRVAIPDFFLPTTNEIVEIKSTWTYDEINMKDKFKAYREHGYKCKLILEHKDVVI